MKKLEDNDRRQVEDDIKGAIAGVENMILLLNEADLDEIRDQLKPAARNLKRELQDMLANGLTADDLNHYHDACKDLATWGAWHVTALKDLVDWFGGREPLEAREIAELIKKRQEREQKSGGKS